MLQIDGHVLDVDDYYITEDYDGSEWLEFDISTASDEYKFVTELAVITSEKNNYIINKIDGNSKRYIHISADVDRRDFQSVFYENYDGGSKTLSRAIADFLPDGWTFVNCGNTDDRRTLRIDYGTALDLLDECSTLYGVVFLFNAKLKILTAKNPEAFEPSAAFVTEELNLKSLQYYGDASDCITRLEARGKDGMTFVGAVVDGKTIKKSYVENYKYSQKIVYGYWSDERYTVKEDLYKAAQERINEWSVPSRSYECDVTDLKSIEPEKYSAFDLSLYQKVKLVDVSRETVAVCQVIRTKVYPLRPEKNIITLSTAAPQITSQLDEMDENIYAVQQEAAQATDWLTDDADGDIYFERSGAGSIVAQIIKCSDGSYIFYNRGIAYSMPNSAVQILLDENGAFHINSGEIAGFEIHSDGLQGENGLTINASNGIIDVGNVRLQKGENESEAVLNNAQEDSVITLSANTKISFAYPVVEDGETTDFIETANVETDCDGDAHSKITIDFIDLSDDGLQELAAALAPYLQEA